jgi:hypothetical protein
MNNTKTFIKAFSGSGKTGALTEYTNNMKAFLNEGLSRQVVITNHVSGYRVTLKDFEYGEVCSDTGPSMLILVEKCISKYDNNVKKLKAEKVEKLSRRKKEIQRELKEVSNELRNIMLDTFTRDDKP